MGVGAVAGYLLSEELEHYRCGIGCILESGSNGEVFVGGLIKGGTGFASGNLQQGDEILQINQHAVTRHMRVDEVASFIRGKEGSVVTITVRKPMGVIMSVRLVRQRPPGGKTEMLGALFQSPSGRKLQPENLTLDQKLDVLAQLRSRGNLTATEFEQAKQRLMRTGRIQDALDKEALVKGDGLQHWYDGERRRTTSSDDVVSQESTPTRDFPIRDFATKATQPSSSDNLKAAGHPSNMTGAWQPSNAKRVLGQSWEPTYTM